MYVVFPSNPTIVNSTPNLSIGTDNSQVYLTPDCTWEFIPNCNSLISCLGNITSLTPADLVVSGDYINGFTLSSRNTDTFLTCFDVSNCFGGLIGNNGIIVSGSFLGGYALSPSICPNADNLLQFTTGGLCVIPNPVNVDGLTIVGNGTSLPLEVNISPNFGNNINVLANGIYVGCCSASETPFDNTGFCIAPASNTVQDAIESIDTYLCNTCPTPPALCNGGPVDWILVGTGIGNDPIWKPLSALFTC